MPKLAKVAVRVLSMVPAAAGCERNWSLMGSVSGGKHARISSTTCTKWVYVRANLEFMKKRKDCESSGVEWEVDEDLDSDGGIESSDDDESSASDEGCEGSVEEAIEIEM